MYPAAKSLSLVHTASQTTARRAPFWSGVRLSAALDLMTCLALVRSIVSVVSKPLLRRLSATLQQVILLHVCRMCHSMKRGLASSRLNSIPLSVRHFHGCPTSHPRRFAESAAAPMGPRHCAHPLGGLACTACHALTSSCVGMARLGTGSVACHIS